ncbi:hypothetical protein PIB30_094387 [Stylosanthes scabra]|uniref:Uncharacterized protein n=1 Tax=Stylosanthes scabra TaxID=79078 RepID=A0ABU6XV29_9FABA|nr:hypothetical protein [Stylosanthes scabra]
MLPHGAPSPTSPIYPTTTHRREKEREYREYGTGLGRRTQNREKEKAEKELAGTERDQLQNGPRRYNGAFLRPRIWRKAQFFDTEAQHPGPSSFISAAAEDYWHTEPQRLSSPSSNTEESEDFWYIVLGFCYPIHILPFFH